MGFGNHYTIIPNENSQIIYIYFFLLHHFQIVLSMTVVFVFSVYFYGFKFQYSKQLFY